MRNLSRFFPAILLGSVIFLFSCKKNSNDNAPIELEYKINTTQLDAFTNIDYVDASGNQVDGVVPMATSFSKTITLTQIPFTAKMVVKVISKNTSELNYDLLISVNGVIKKLVSGRTPPFSSTTTEVEFVVN